MEIKNVGVIGAGQMGSGIAHVFALAGFDVLLNDIDLARAKAALATIEQNLARQIEKGRIEKADGAAALARIRPVEKLNDLAACDYVVETVAENIEIKKTVLSELSSILKKDAVMASNTSSISITALAASTDRPEKFIGLHFMNPPPVMQLIEVIRGIATSKETFETSKSIVERLGKTMAVAEDFPAFIVNRVLMPMINEAIYTLYEGVGSVEAIDKAMKLGAMDFVQKPFTIEELSKKVRQCLDSE